MSEIRAYIIKITGDVQGVFFRHHTVREAKKLGLLGWTQNEHDGSVTIFAQGDPEKVKELINWAHEGSPMATVQDVTVEVAEIDEALTKFEVR
ncbi:MAG: acylphosphatase [Patescibacteria group bacterium]|nr:acylphosphatase [Patescibacteria group bacterium]